MKSYYVNRRLVFSSFFAVSILNGAVALASDVPSNDRSDAVTDLATLIQAAERNNPGIRATNHNIAAARARLNEAWVSPFFQFDVTTSFGLAPEARGTSAVTAEDSQLPVDNRWLPVFKTEVKGAIPLWTFGKLSAARQAARAAVRGAELDRDQKKAELLFDVRRAYYALQLALDIQQMISEGRNKLANAVERLDKRLESDDPEVNQSDKYRLASTLAEVDARSSEAVRLAESSVAALQILTGIKLIRVPDCPLEPVDFAPESITTYKKIGRKERPEAGMLRAAIVATEADLDANQARYFPDIALALQASTSYSSGITDQSNPFVPDPANYNSFGAALVARWSLDFWGNAYRVERSKQNLLKINSGLDQALDGIALEVATTHSAVMDAKRRVEAWKKGHQETRRWFVSAAQAEEVGVGETKELVDAVGAYFKARYNHLQAVYDFNLAVAHLERTIGSSLLTLDEWNQSCE
ncbi:MAG: TolC family protein [Deltaproteobacteria bacterium]|nr:TolC family protein [Deltaproteobacteria bacterium]